MIGLMTVWGICGVIGIVLWATGRISIVLLEDHEAKVSRRMWYEEGEYGKRRARKRMKRCTACTHYECGYWADYPDWSCMNMVWGEWLGHEARKFEWLECAIGWREFDRNIFDFGYCEFYLHDVEEWLPRDLIEKEFRLYYEDTKKDKHWKYDDVAREHIGY